LGAPLGIATTRFEDRLGSAMGLGQAAVKFEAHQGILGGGILFLLPALLSQGLLKTKEIYQVPASHYYGLESVLLTLAFMALARIKNPEQLKQCKPGEIGKIIGLDRIPEVRCLRNKIKILSGQEQAQNLNNLLANHWHTHTSEQDKSFLYIDGHVRIYYGHKANLPVKFISRQKLCLSATSEYWVNDAQGLPVMMVMGELTEKLQEMIEHQIIPQLQQTEWLKDMAASASEKTELTTSETLKQEPVLLVQPICTFVFDREAYEPLFFQRLWNNHRIAIITYRKNVKDNWSEDEFKSTTVSVLGQNITMLICEKRITLNGVSLREIRKLNEGGHQTSIITTNEFISTEVTAGRMFGRWSQENFFRYMIMDYDFDKMIEFGVEAVDENKEVVNPIYRKISHQLKKQKEKTRRLKAQLYPLAKQCMDAPIEQIPALSQQQITLKEKIKQHELLEDKLVQERSSIAPRIKINQMPKNKMYNKLKTESKQLMNVIKMICYRAETAVANIVAEHLKGGVDEKRMLVKQIIQAQADIVPNYENKTLKVRLHGLSAKRFNHAATKLAELLNQTETIFPGTNLKIIFETNAELNCEV
jgi:hypothetical protein